MIRDIFTAVDGAETSRAFLAALRQIVERLDLHLHVAVLTPAPMISPALAPLGSLYEPGFTLREKAKTAELAVRAQFMALGDHVRVTGEFDDVAFLPGDLKRTHPVGDLNIIGGSASWDVPWLRQHVIEALVFNSGTPVLLMPNKPVLRPLDHIVVGWKPTAESVSALHDVVATALPGALIELVTVSSEAIDGEDRLNAVQHLELHGFRAEHRWLKARGGAAGQLQEYAKRRRAAMLAVGAFGHSRFREMILGGVTRSYVRDVRLPTLLSR
ncbi:universal stress protein [Sphingomonas oryzagri]